MRKERFSPDTPNSFDGKSKEELELLLKELEGYAKAQVIFALGRKSRGQPELMPIVLREAASLDNQSTIAAFNHTVAMLAALSVVDNGQPADMKALKPIVGGWADNYQKEDFYDILKSLNVSL